MIKQKIKILDQKGIVKEIKNLLKKRTYRPRDSIFFELYVNLYLILSKKRRLAQVVTGTPSNAISVKHFLQKHYPYFIHTKGWKTHGGVYTTFVLHHPRYPVKNMNQTFGKAYAKDLGPFYVCAGDLKEIYRKHKYLLRPVIDVSYENKFGKEMQFELFAQMCPPQMAAKNLPIFYKIVKTFKTCLKKIHPNLSVHLTMGTYHKR